MQYKLLGRSGLKVSVTGFGGIPVQRVNQKQATETILKASECGINFIDTARGYTISEEFIGEALWGTRKNWIIATKSMARDKDSMAKDIEISLKNLKTDHIDLYQLHNIRKKTDLNRIFKEDGAYEALLDAQKAGKIGHIGITSHSCDLLEDAIELNKFESIMVPYNIVETQAEKLMKRAQELNIGVIIMKPMAGGAIQDVKLAMKFVLANSAVTTAIPGMADIGEVLQNAAAGEHSEQLTERDFQSIDKIRAILGSKFCRRCGYCAPCPEGIEIPNMFLYSGYKERYNLADWAEKRYYAERVRANACKECGACEAKCPYNLPIRKMLKDVRKLFGD